jgi:hypothetical protein
MSFSHAGDFDQIILLTINNKISQEEGQGRTAPIVRNSLPKGALFLPGSACPPRPRRGKILLDNKPNRGKIVTRQGACRPDPNLINPVAQAKCS